ncbi:GNAT family N-acetyltransferase [Streptomyces sp. ME19-01-6]|uniref:GNAT family N-acetyltransferase n=1 Tax=Streptomyces sp. ME19-01-6 TaxID=3028686 RepID=UPI0029BDC201|nr:GNAT family N-acetyltransferase [Streptomyces sp. ME19-01-6]MDX3230670.1 GNAT family N-acetyltransferase [Streptomyces sp. ME19-01-6]
MVTEIRLTAEATPGAPALLLRPWVPADAVALAELYRDGALRRWARAAVDDEAGAARWIQEQQRGWQAGSRFTFAVVESRTEAPGGRLAGHVVLKNVAPGAPSAEVGYWTAAHARGREVAPRALRALTDWAFTTFAGDGLTRLELLHQVDNAASCRVAQKCRYELTALLPAAPPAFPLDGHLHVRSRSAQIPALVDATCR